MQDRQAPVMVLNLELLAKAMKIVEASLFIEIMTGSLG